MLDELLDCVRRLIADADDHHALAFETFLKFIQIRDAGAAGQARGGKYLHHEMFVPALTSTGLPLIHSLTASGAAGSPIWPPRPITGAKPAIRPQSQTAYFMIICDKFVPGWGREQVPNTPR